MSVNDHKMQGRATLKKREPGYVTGRSPYTSVRFGALSNRGKVRSQNEDHYAIVKRIRSQELMLANLQMTDLNYFQEESHLLMLADGVGGNAFGEIASELALRTVWEVTEQMSSWMMRVQDYDSHINEIEERVTAVTQSIQAVFESVGKTSPEMKEMGTTFTAAYLMGPDAVIINLGDSRAYLSRNGRVLQLTRDHTLAQDLIEEGAEPEEVDRVRHVLMRCFSANSHASNPEIQHVRLIDNDVLMLCTDGLTDMVSDNAIATQLNQTSDPQLVCGELVDAALQEGGKDNITVIVARMEILPS